MVAARMSGDRYAVLASRSGTNLQALLEANIANPVVLITDVECGAQDRARAAQIPTEVVAFEGDRAVFTDRILAVASAYQVEALVLAGFMRILGPAAPNALPDRIVNIHPSLLPSFPGPNAVAQALEAGVKVSGVTVHFVDDLVDHGPIIAQHAVPVLEDDDVESLHARIQREEHRLYPRVVKALVQGRLLVKDGRVIWT